MRRRAGAAVTAAGSGGRAVGRQRGRQFWKVGGRGGAAPLALAPSPLVEPSVALLVAAFLSDRRMGRGNVCSVPAHRYEVFDGAWFDGLLPARLSERRGWVECACLLAACARGVRLYRSRVKPAFGLCGGGDGMQTRGVSEAKR